MKNILRGVAAALLCLLPSLHLSARQQLINNAGQLSTNSVFYNQFDNWGVQRLVDNDPTTSYKSKTSEDGMGGVSPYVQVQFENDITLGDDEDLIVMLQRSDSGNYTPHQPTTFRVEVSMDGSNFTEYGYIYFLYRGVKTKEYSSRIRPDGTFRYMRFTVIANNSRSTDGQGHRSMQMAELQIYRLGHTEDYSPVMRDRFHSVYDFGLQYYDYAFENTRGILDPVNRQNGDKKTWYKDEVMQGWDDNGDWIRDADALAENEIEMPSYRFLDNDPANPHYDPTLEPGQKRQPTHTTEHILYAIPGDAIALYPYYSFATTGMYQENFSHWYDWRTGKSLSYQLPNGQKYALLDFLIDPTLVCLNKDNGFFAGNDVVGTKSVQIYTADDYINFVNTVKGGVLGLSADIMADLDFSGKTVQPIGSDDNPFIGYINGHNHTIRNLHINVDHIDAGLVGYAGNGAVICNLNIDSSCSFTGTSHVGVVGRISYGSTITLSQVVTEAKVTATGSYDNNNFLVYAGALVGQGIGNSNIYDCRAGGTVTGATKPTSIGNDSYYHYVAAISGSATSDSKWRGIYSDVSVINGVDGMPYFVGKEEELEVNNVKYTVIKAPKWYADAGALQKIIPGRQTSEWTALVLTKENGKWVRLITKPNDVIEREIEFDYHCYGMTENEGFKSISTLQANDAGVQAIGNYRSKYQDPFNNNWEVDNARLEPKCNYEVGLNFDANLRKYGTVATFFCPRDTKQPDGVLENLPFPEGTDEFIIAADFAQDYDPAYNIVDGPDGTKIIKEPIIQFRHLFRIRDGKDFAEAFSGSKENNEEYIRKNMRYISAREDVEFQVRLDSPVPVQKGTDTPRSKYYYKISNTDYRRVCSMKIDVYDADTGRKLENNIHSANVDDVENRFYLGETFNGEGSRKIDGIKYWICGGGGSYYRMLKCNPAYAKGHYIVKLIACDINGNRIKIIGTDTDLVVMEYVISFLPKTQALMVYDEDLYDDSKGYQYAREEYLEKNFGAPRDKIDFDEYRFLRLSENIKTDYYFHEWIQYIQGTKYSRFVYKWPIAWNQSNYAFGYDQRHDYNMYMLSNHSVRTPFKAAADRVPASVNDGKSPGMFDRRYYKTKRLHEAHLANPELPDTKIEEGYFYYVNAAADPGVMTVLTVDEMCLGSTVHVSAWVSEFTNTNESANLAFNFVAVMNTGERIPVHTFTSGYVPSATRDDQCSKWYNVYYSFVPDFSHAELDEQNINHYELELDNNCKNSNGADYAIDNIRIYIIKPVLYAEQAEPLCNALVKNVRVKVESPFDVILQTTGVNETPEDNASGNENTIYYTFIDKKKFDLKYKELSKNPEVTNPGKEAYEYAVLRYGYRGDDAHPTTFGRLRFSSRYKDHQEYDPKAALRDMASREELEDGTRMLVFNTEPQDDDLVVGKDFYISLYVPLGRESLDEQFQPGWEEFNIFDDCSKSSVFSVKSSNVIKVDGEVHEEVSEISVCEGQSPVIQVNVYAQKENGEVFLAEEDAYLDWFAGTLDEFLWDKVAENSDVTIKDALEAFRIYFPDATTVDLDLVDEYLKTGKIGRPDQFNMDIAKGLLKLSIPEAEHRNAKLVLMRSSYVFPPVPAVVDEADYQSRVIAVPVQQKKTIDGVDYMLCADPTEIRVKVANRSPRLAHGLRQGIDYPGWLDDVPLRVGLSQLKAVSCAKEQVKTWPNTLNIPVRSASVTKDEIAPGEALHLIDGQPYIYLVETNDPEYKDLGASEIEGGLLPVGEISELKAALGDGNGGDNLFRAVFYDLMHFKEGYYYRMRFDFREEELTGNADEPAAVLVAACDGQDVFTLKVVPEYQKWIGRANRNWNNDDNWSRVTGDDLNGAAVDNSFLVSAEGNSNTFSYAPLDFTKVIVDGVVNQPYLYKAESLTEMAGYDDVPRHTDYTAYGYGDRVMWTATPDKPAAPVAPMETPAETVAEIVGVTTPNVHYDMAAYNSTVEVGDVNCRPWYANTCEQIHFRPESEIMSQQCLNYEKAWVDMELAHSTWYTLSSPLRNAYAGDLYLPTDNARQMTPLFEDISYDVDKNHRFKPAVFQRGWNKGSAIVYELGDKNRSVVIKADWSHVFNDVKEKYVAGTGFSIKTDVTAIADAVGDNKVLFRLPKADTSYNYYTQDYDAATSSGQSGDLQNVAKDGSESRLNPTSGQIESVTAGESKYFFVGNPFMTHLDMRKFLTANAGKIRAKYWIVNESSQKSGSFTDDTFVGDAPELLAPMQGFFVEALDGAAVSGTDGVKLTLAYDESMMADSPAASATSQVGAPARSCDADTAAEHLPGLVISAINDGTVSSTATIIRDYAAVDGYLESEDMTVIDNSGLEVPATVYTLAGDRAVTVNRLCEADKIGLGVIAGRDELTTVLRFDGVGQFDDMRLYDAGSGEFTELYDSMEYPVKGNVAGRLFLTRGVPGESLTVMSWTLRENEVTVHAGAGDRLSIRVYDVTGRTVYTDTRNARENSFTLGDGIYVMEATDGVETIVGKIMIR